MTGKGRGSSKCVTQSRVPQKVTWAQSHRQASGKGAATLPFSWWSRVAPERRKFAGTFASVCVYRRGGLQGPRGFCPQGGTGTGLLGVKVTGISVHRGALTVC